jgi:4-hydroxy 2-oxovalerate aldolase
MKKIKILDATLRDGGQGLDDLFNNKISNSYFTKEFKTNTIESLVNSKIDLIELGAIGKSIDDKSKFCIYQNIEDLSKTIPGHRNDGQMFVGLYIGPDTDLSEIPDWNPSLVEGVRVILRYSELQKSLDYCAALVTKGYKVFVQPMLTMRYSDEELDLVINESNKMGAYACYFVDSYGYMQPSDIQRLFEYFDNGLDKEIKIGFHAHNNMNLAYSNVLSFIGLESDRDIIIDSCATGMGQGAGNLQTELIVPYLNNNFGANYYYNSILQICDELDKGMIPNNMWGYSVTRLLPALYMSAYKYALIMRNRYDLSFVEIKTILESMPDDMRNRYTADNVEKLVFQLKR